MRPQVFERIRGLPDQPGIYVFKASDGTPLYVGKAKSLRRRAANYAGGGHDIRIATMIAEAVDLDWVVTDTEAEALLLENTWIKRRQPRYNVQLRDDKTYPYLKLTRGEAWPRLAFTRRIRDDRAEYFGPYLPAGIARKAIKLVQKLFRVRVCSIEIDGRLPRPCLYYDMHRCLGPCVDGLTTPEAYASAVEEASLFLAGRNDALLRRMRREMENSAERLEYEEAARLRDAIAEIEMFPQRSKLSSVDGDDVDVYGVQVGKDHAAVAILVMREGQLLDRRDLFWEGEGPVAPERLLAELLPQIYDRTSFLPKEIHLPVPIDEEDQAVLLDWLSERKGERVFVRLPARGVKADRVALAMRNAEAAYRRRFRGSVAVVGEAGTTEASAIAPEALFPGAEALASHLGLAEAPRRIEGFDVSNLQGGETVASLVVWQDGRMRKNEYRSFNIRGLPAQDDFASIRQAVERHYRRRLDEVSALPDLVLIDGGRGQLNAALQGLATLGIEETPIVSLAKRDEEVYFPAAPAPLRLPREDQGLRLLQTIRDEAHRFAVSRHRRRRNARTLRSRLDDLVGIGPRRRRLLLERFGSVEGVRAASVEELAAVVGGKVAASVLLQLAEPSGESGPG